MKEYFLKLYGFNSWANDRVLSCLKKQSVNDAKIISILGHYIAAQFIWLHRLKGLDPPPYKLWGEYNLEQLDKMSAEAGKLWMDYVRSNDNFNRELTYKNYVGDPYTNNVESIMIHLVNHCTYHRAQVALLLREKGYEPINTDFITYDRVLRGEWKD